MIYIAPQHNFITKQSRSNTHNDLKEAMIKCGATRLFLVEPGISQDFTSPQSSATQLPHRANKRAN